MKHKDLYESKIKEAPKLPGCYIWKDSKGGVLYVGKAVNIRNRVSSYVKNYEKLDPKIRQMVDLVDDVEFYTVDNEVEALILETNLIKKYRPKYNKLMKDDKNYSYLMIDWHNPYPSLRVVREKKDKKAEYFGPYPDRFPVFKVLRNLRKIFPYCTHLPKSINNLKISDEKRFNSKPCFNYHIGLCSGVCINKISKTEHRKNINGIRRFFQGKKLKMSETLEKEMKKYSKKRDFEKAAVLRDKIKDLSYVTQHIKIERDMDEDKLIKMKKDLRSRAIEDLVKRVSLTPYQKESDYKIECYDISNIQGTNPVGSMVVFVGGKPDKNLYRKFKIKTKETPDDFAMMREVLSRRLKYLSEKTYPLPAQAGVSSNEDPPLSRRRQGSDGQAKGESKYKDKSFSEKPNLIIIDGGKGQLSSAYQMLKEASLLDDIDLVGLAKREEEIFQISETNDPKNPYDFEKFLLPRRSESLYLVQRVRDEAHRFAVGFHRTLRSKGQIKSILDDIPGVGPVVKKRLIAAFGSVDRIKKATADDIASVVKNKRTVAAIVKLLKIENPPADVNKGL